MTSRSHGMNLKKGGLSRISGILKTIYIYIYRYIYILASHSLVLRLKTRRVPKSMGLLELYVYVAFWARAPPCFNSVGLELLP